MQTSWTFWSTYYQDLERLPAILASCLWPLTGVKRCCHGNLWLELYWPSESLWMSLYSIQLGYQDVTTALSNLFTFGHIYHLQYAKCQRPIEWHIDYEHLPAADTDSLIFSILYIVFASKYWNILRICIGISPSDQSLIRISSIFSIYLTCLRKVWDIFTSPSVTGILEELLKMISI